ncbi:MAG: class I SAM-dependent methyltransferase [Candidatus Borkfalkiaceae bacterium]|nr:class I SAM-dependent methyltransferase [Clostridia bacterium]MDY6223235.1 class I SAM-dependent methyltransferase [Christensenellaceae bacterium]
MAYTERIKILCSHLKPAKTFADVGCDHGYMSEYMLQKKLCEKLYFSDVSKGSLEKAEKRLAAYVKSGAAVPVLGDGFYGVPKDTQEVLIAGMGGSEIVEILSHETYGFLPGYFVFQPMLDGEKLRRYLLKNGAYLLRDYTFFCGGKPYDCIVGRKKEAGEETQRYSRAELAFGKENVQKRPQEFIALLKKKAGRVQTYLRGENLSERSREELTARYEFLREVIENDCQ